MVEPGLEAIVQERVTDAMTAASLASGDVPVLGTPAVLALAERAACAAINGELGEGETSVGTWVELSHMAPTPVGGTVTATARLTHVDGRKLAFDLSVSDGSGEIARGTHRRVVVEKERFVRSADERSS
jgi:predicted thioesterase